MARAFVTASSEFINTTPGAMSANDGGDFTAAVMLRHTADGTDEAYVRLYSSTPTLVVGLRRNASGNVLNFGITAGALSTFTLTAADGWVLIVGSKATGTVAPRLSKYVFSSNTWTHENGGSTLADNTISPGGSGTIRFGQDTASRFFGGDMAAAACWNRALTDAERELLPHSLAMWLGLVPDAFWVFDQAAVTQALYDLTGGGANESSRTGTAVSTTSVPVLGYGHPVMLASRVTAASSSPAAECATATAAADNPAAGVAVAAGCATATAAANDAPIFPLGWDFRRPITIDQTVVDADLTNFPVLVRLTAANFTFANAQTGGQDIRFTTAAGTLLDFERERHDDTNDLAEYWVRVPAVSGTVDTVIYVYYGNATVSDGAGATGLVWDANYLGVWHLGEDPSVGAPQFLESNQTANSATAVNLIAGDQVDGKIGKGLNFGGTNQHVTIPTTLTLQNLTQYMIEAWVKTDSVGTKRDVFEQPRGATSSVTRSKLAIETTSTFTFQGRSGDADGLSTYVNPGTTVVVSTWYYLCAVFDSVSDTHQLWIDGTKNTNSVAAATIANTAPLTTSKIGSRADGTTEFWDGVIDEVRISDTVRSDAWIKASYNSGNGSLLAVGSEEPLGGTSVSAECATGAAVGHDAAPRVAPSAEAGAATAAAHDAQAQVAGAAENAAATGVAADATTQVATSAEAASAAAAVVDVAVSVRAPADVAAASATAAAPTATVAVVAAAEHAPVTATASDATATVMASPETATATAAAHDPQTSVTAAAEVPQGTGTAGDVTAQIGVFAGVAAAAGAGADATITVTPVASDAAATGVAGDPSGGVAPPGESASIVAAALDATVTTSGAVAVFPDTATVTATGLDTAATIAPNADTATTTATAVAAAMSSTTAAEHAPAVAAAGDPAPGVGAAAEPGTVTAAAMDPTVGIGAFAAAEAATATVTVGDPQPSVSAAAEAVTVTAAAFDATVTTSAGTSVNAECATGTASAANPAAGIAPPGEAATATAATTDPSGSVGAAAGNGLGTTAGLDLAALVAASAEAALATLAALDLSASVAPSSGAATGTVTAGDGTVVVGTTVNPDTATGSSAALDPAPGITSTPETATAVAGALDPAAGVSAPAGAGGGTAAAGDVAPSSGAAPTAATAAASAANATVLIVSSSVPVRGAPVLVTNGAAAVLPSLSDVALPSRSTAGLRTRSKVGTQ